MIDPRAEARRYNDLFGAVYLLFHRRDGKRAELPNASRAVLTHLEGAGPVTVSEAARHLDRAQAVVSEIVDGLERRALLERERDPADRRRTLVWLTPTGREALRHDRDVLGVENLAAALERMDPTDRAALITSTSALVAAHRKENVMNSVSCESCGMPIESGPYCSHCVDPHGVLQSFDERFERMSDWQARRHPEQSRAEVESATLRYMAGMPAWREHPRVVAAHE